MSIQAEGDRPGKLERWCTTLHAGSTADGHERHRPHVHLGLHGTGLGPICAVSESLQVSSWRDGQGWTQRFVRGVPVSLPRMELVGCSSQDPEAPVSAWCNLLPVTGGAFVSALRRRWPKHALAVSLWLPEPVYDGRTRSEVSDPRALQALDHLA